ncbi:MAG: 2-oxo acid dehydrogenase subunit E2 [Anaerolineae bacterium]|nr:2-oxo acid dehydrogenase subunit E2 [Anaerolineae bacterium]
MASLPRDTVNVPIGGTRLQQSYQQVPHITFDVDVDVSAAEALRARANAKLKEGQAKIGLTAIVAKACAWALQRHPMINSRLDEAAGQIVLLDEVNIGIAVALDGGLIVPVVRNAQAKGVQQIANKIADLSVRAKANKLKQDEISSGTFSISNLGMYGVDRFTAIINPPEVAILAMGRSKMSFVPGANGQPVAKPIMTIRLSADHRVVDGAVAAQFLGDVRAAIEEPAMMAL